MDEILKFNPFTRHIKGVAHQGALHGNILRLRTRSFSVCYILNLKAVELAALSCCTVYYEMRCTRWF